MSIKRVIVILDAHIELTLPKPYQVVKRFAKWYKPDEVILAGDFISVDALSAYDMRKKRLIEGKRYEKEIDVCNKELDFWCSVAKKVTYMEGNHEDRVERYIDDHPEMEGLIELPIQLELKKRGVEWIKYGKAIWRSKLAIAHGIYYGQMFAKKTVLDYGSCILVGHTHRFQVHTLFPKHQKYPFVCYGLGTLGNTDPAYVKGKPTGHIHQFALLEYSEKQFNLYPVNVINNSFLYDGKYWSLK